jgi:quinol-cytochrome oxidoreductase complex cytochrome b subunit
MLERVRRRWRGGPSAWWRASVVLAAVAGVLILVLAVTGAYLSFRYRPQVSEAFEGVEGLEGFERHGLPETMRTVHTGASTLLFWAGFGLFVTGLGRAVQSFREGNGRRATAAAGGLPLALLVAVVLASFTGYLVAYEQLALGSITVASGFDGVWAAAFDADVVFILVEGSEVEQSEFARWVLVHVAAVPIVLIALTAAIGRKLTRRTASEPPSS